MEDLYLVEQGCTIKREDIKFIISKEGVKLRTLPYYDIDKILLIGNQQITTQALNLAFESNIDVLFLSTMGKLKGKISPLTSKNIYVRMAQYEIIKDKKKRLKLAKTMVKGKVINQMLLIKRYGKSSDEIERYIERIDKVQSNEELMGIEGIVSKIYFNNLTDILPKDIEFKGRNRRPAKDPANALLSLTYTMVLNQIIAEIDKQGLDGYMGFLHTLKYGRESLALDLLEEFRQYFCDGFVIKLFNRKEFKLNDFDLRDEGLYLNENAFRQYLIKFNKSFNPIKKVLSEQVEAMKSSILQGKDYSPLQYGS